MTSHTECLPLGIPSNHVTTEPNLDDTKSSKFTEIISSTFSTTMRNNKVTTSSSCKEINKVHVMMPLLVTIIVQAC